MSHPSSKIIVFVNCKHPTAKGDYSFGSLIALDLLREYERTGRKDISIVILSTLDRIHNIHELFPVTEDGHVIIEDKSFELHAIEEYDLGMNDVSAFIFAKLCSFVSSTLLKTAITARTKFIIIDNVNGTERADDVKVGLMVSLMYRQPSVYNYFNHDDVLIKSAGFSQLRYGLPSIRTVEELPPLLPHELQLMPATPFGFIYFSNKSKNINQHVVEFMHLTLQPNYVFVGNNYLPHDIREAFDNFSQYHSEQHNFDFPEMIFHANVPNRVMRKMMDASEGSLIATTGTLSTLEALQNRLVYYQFQENNAQFVNDFLTTFRLSLTTPSDDKENEQAFTLINLLFRPKPLSKDNYCQLKQLLAHPKTVEKTIRTNELIIKKAKGTLAPRLMLFIDSKHSSDPVIQYKEVERQIRNIRRNKVINKKILLSYAARDGLLFELKILLGGHALNYLNYQDCYQRTPLHYAVSNNNLSCVKLLVNYGARLDLKDFRGETPIEIAKVKKLPHINAFLEERIDAHKESVVSSLDSITTSHPQRYEQL